MCQCGLYIQSHSPEVTEQKLRACLEDSVNEHSAHCPHTPEFSVTEGTEEKSCLLMSCLVSLPREPVVESGSAVGFIPTLVEKRNLVA